MENNPGIYSKLLSRISYLESLLTSNNIPFEPDNSFPAKLSNNVKTLAAPIKTSLALDSQEKENPLTHLLIERYSRQMLLSEISYKGQKKISESRVLVVGAGGIGTPALYYLSGLGIGTIGIIDGDLVEETNLHRQILHKNKRIGVNKAVSACETLKEYNPYVNYEVYPEHLTVKNANKIISQYDIILDASDNAFTRYLLNDLAILHRKVLISGSALGWEGQITVFGLGSDSPCYRCLFPVCPKNLMSCGDAGVVGMVPGIIGLLEAMEALKVIIGVGDVLSKEMLLYDGMRGVFKRVKLRGRQKECCLCGDESFRKIKNVEEYDYENFVGKTCSFVGPPVKAENNITWEKFLEVFANEPKEKMLLVDCRGESHYNIVHLPPFKNIPLQKLKKMGPEEIKEIVQDKEKVYVMCRTGNTSRAAVVHFLNNNISNVYNIEGGIKAFGDQGYGLVPKI